MGRSAVLDTYMSVPVSCQISISTDDTIFLFGEHPFSLSPLLLFLLPCLCVPTPCYTLPPTHTHTLRHLLVLCMTEKKKKSRAWMQGGVEPGAMGGQKTLSTSHPASQPPVQQLSPGAGFPS